MRDGLSRISMTVTRTQSQEMGIISRSSLGGKSKSHCKLQLVTLFSLLCPALTRRHFIPNPESLLIHYQKNQKDKEKKNPSTSQINNLVAHTPIQTYIHTNNHIENDVLT